MAVPPLGATGLDNSDPSAYGSTGGGVLAPSSMAAPEGMLREAYNRVAIDRDRDLDGVDIDAEPLSMGYGDPVKPLTRSRALELLRDASSQSRTFFETNVHSPWQRSYGAVRNEHYKGSIYLSDAYRTRSKLFKPKTRSALWKRLASTTKAMFTTTDVVSIMAEDDSNPQEVVAATLKQEILNYRLKSISPRNGIPWLMTATGARYDADVTGICCSKQSWIFKERRVGETTAMGGGANILVDRPDVALIPPENIRFDPNANWINVAQHSAYLLVQFPMTPDAAMDFVRQNAKSKIKWIPGLSEEYFRSRTGSDPTETTSPRSARAGSGDPQQQASGNFRNVWLTEVFMRYQGVDYNFWALNDGILLSEPVETQDMYPHLSGERPIVIGTSQIEPHKAYVMSAVEAWQPLQQESNDSTNLRLDHQKRIIAPPLKVMRGQKVDLQSLQRRGPNQTILVNAQTDVEPMEMPDVPGSLFTEQNILNADFDDLAGNFNASSVQTSKQMNETVGGMHLLAESGNQVADFDLTIWNETWVTPVVSQLLRLEEYYENDAKVLALCGERAQLWQKFGINSITDEMLRSESTVRVNIGVGATSLPMERVQRFSAAWDTAAKAIAPFIQTGIVQVIPDAEAIVDDIFQAASFRDGGKRYFKYIGPNQQPPQQQQDPKAQAAMLSAQAKMQQNQIAQERNQGQMMLDAHKMNDQRASQYLALHNQAADRKASLQIQQMKQDAAMAQTRADMSHEAAMHGISHAHDHVVNQSAPFLTQLASRLAPPKPGGDGKGTAPNTGARGDPSRPMIAPMPSPHLQPQPGMFASLDVPKVDLGARY